MSSTASGIQRIGVIGYCAVTGTDEEYVAFKIPDEILIHSNISTSATVGMWHLNITTVYIGVRRIDEVARFTSLEAARRAEYGLRVLLTKPRT